MDKKPFSDMEELMTSCGIGGSLILPSEEAVLETNGQLSVLLLPQWPVFPEDLKLDTQYEGMPW